MGDHDDRPMAEDAIPTTAIRLTEAFMMVVDAVQSNPEKITTIDEDWSTALVKSREFEKALGHDPKVFDEEFEKEWHLHKVANVILRCALDDGALNACIFNPQTGETLYLPSEGWLTDKWLDRGYIPSGIWRDNAIPDDDELPGPAATLIAGELRSIFLNRGGFETWLSREFGSKASSRDTTGKRLRDAVTEAVDALWGGNIPPGISHKIRNDQIKEWLVSNGRLKASDATIRRALGSKKH
jgi:hypothetical protein